MNKSWFRHTLAGATLFASCLVIGFHPVQATDDPNVGIPVGYKDYTPLVACNQNVTSFCVQSWAIDLDNNGSFEVPSQNSGITFSSWVWDSASKRPGLVYEIRANGNQEASPTVPAGTAIQFTINTGAFQPPPSMFTEADVVAFGVNIVNGQWITTGTVKTDGYSFATDCDPENQCANPTNRHDYVSYFQGAQFYEEPSALRDSEKGMWVKSTASTTYGLAFDNTTLTFEVQLMGPALKANGTPNVLKYQAFVPDTFIQFAYGTTADLLVNALATFRTDGSATTPLASTITRVTTPIAGVLISMPNIALAGSPVTSQSVHSFAGRYTTTPKLKIKPKNSLLRAPRISRAIRVASGARISGTRVAGATKYQAMCSRGSVSKTATAKTPTITVKGLTAGTWKCTIRAVAKVGGRWAQSFTVSVK